jgi:hypothetical protein
MKMMFFQDCHDLVVPAQAAGEVRRCQCRRHACWWENPVTGKFRLHDASFKPIETKKGSKYEFYPPVPRAYVIGLTNMIFGFPGDMTAEAVQDMIEAHEDHYLFKKWRSLVIRLRPGESGDTAWAALP